MFDFPSEPATPVPVAGPGQKFSKNDFERLRGLIYAESGINLGPEKKTMLEVRLRRRLHSLQMSSCTEYCNYLFGPEGRSKELSQLINVVSTNKTDFFREAGHFDFLVSHILPEIAARKGVRRRSLVWSAGCSTGEEPYTIAMVLSEYAERQPGFQFQVLATDISTAVLAKAQMGIFRSEVAEPVPVAIRRRYFLRSRDRGSNLLRIVPELRERVEFRHLNLMDAEFGLTETPEMIFCRNVIIYFDRPTQTRILKKFAHVLAPGGYFFAGHSESLQGMNLPLVAVGTSVYQKVRDGMHN